MDKYELCRLCALKHNNLVSIYGEEGIRLSIEQKIKKCLNIELNVNNLPNSICSKCCSKLDAFDEFVDITNKAQDALKVIFSESGINDLNTFGSQEGLKPVENSLNEDYNTETYNIENIATVNNPISINIRAETCPEDCESLTDNCSVHTKSVLIESVNNGRICNNSFNLDIEEEKNKDWDLHTWLCCDCSEELPSVEDLRRHHETEHKQETKYMCAYCSKLFHLYSAFTTHLKRHKNSLKHNCHECGKSFSNKKVLEAHTLTHSDARHYSCQDCGKAFRQQSALYIHTRCHLPDDIKNKFPCEMCNKRFSTKPNLVTHMRIHTGIKNFTCDQCGKSFIQKGNLNAHLLTHSHDKPYFCEICNKRFKTGMQLRKHHSVHTGTKPHQCDICGRTFREKGTLREHHRIHTGAMPFTCEFCGKSFRFKGILTTHRRQHTGERPYSCLECQHHFTNWPNYNKHMKRRHGINTSRSSRGPPGEGEVDDAPAPSTLPAQNFSDIQAGPEGYHSQPPLPSYVYNVYGLPQVPLEPLPL